MSPRSMISLPVWPAHRILNAAVALLLLQVGLAACGGEPEASDQAEQTTQDQESAPGSETTADADSGFRPQTHGFSFPNYGDEHPEVAMRRVVRGVVRRGLQPVPAKTAISLRVDQDVLEWFKAQGDGYQTRINAVLRAFRDASA